MAKKREEWWEKEIHLEKWLHKKLDFKNPNELILFMAWAVMTCVVLLGVK